MKPFLLVLSSPSGGGKSTIAHRLLETRSDLVYSVSATTRSPRDGEANGVAYHFLTPAEFEGRVSGGAFLEWAQYGGHRYGTLRDQIEAGLASGRHVVLDIEVQGARQLKERFANAVHVFVLPPSGAVLVDRLRGRGTDSLAAIAKRVEIARSELAAAPDYDYVVVNDDLAAAVARVGAIVDAESARPQRLGELESRIDAMARELGGLVKVDR